ncbi:MAG TPA: SRPBCC family protein [Dehalococcoidia bacterium]|nr:SRPBCC family protein [Dehalococcoidia bacterium]
MNVVEETEVAAPPEKVYEYLLDFRKHTEWTTPNHIVRISPISEGPTVVGSTFDSEGHQFGAQRDRLEVTELMPNRKIVYEATMKNGQRFRHTLEMQAATGGTRLTKRFESLKLTFSSVFLAPIVARLILPRALAGDLKRIKANLEKPAG